MFVADLHIHSRFSRATSKDCDLPHLDWWARRKGIHLIGTGDFTHPAWRAELKEQLVPAETGVYTLRKEYCLSGHTGQATRFVVSGEISSIYKRNGKTRKVHNLILLPSLEAADELSAKLEAIGNIHSDGRPILGLDSRDLLELTMETCPDAEFIPAHIWTPHFSMFGAFSDFNSIEACFDDMTPYIHAVETGLSSDPPMNWRVSMLDHLTLVSHSDAHSPSKLGREANLLDTGLAYPEWVHAIRTGEGFLGTIEFFPEEGKYHLDGHRNCGVCLTPAETVARNGFCPVCGKKLTIGVEHRVEELADRPLGFRPPHAKPFESLAPLPEVITATSGWSVTSKKNVALYEQLLHTLGPEFYILRQVPIEEIQRVAGPCLAEGIRRLRLGQVERRPGFDGEYGTISLLTPYEREQFNGQTSLFGAAPAKPKAKPKPLSKQLSASPAKTSPVPQQQDVPNPEQQSAVSTPHMITAVVAGPGTGKTKTLVSRIAYLIEEQGAKPSEITAVTFTRQAAAEMKERLQKRLGGKRAIAHMTIGTFHAICRNLLGDVQLISQEDALSAASTILHAANDKQSPKSFLQAVSRVKNGASFHETNLDESLYTAYHQHLQTLQVLDFDDLLTEARKLDVTGRKAFTHLLVDEFQDINQVQYDLIRSWSHASWSLFVIGDPDQSIYGFRGATGTAFEQLRSDFPDLQLIHLVQNYRSTPQILEASLPILHHPLSHLSATCPSGPAVRLIQTHDDFSEGVWITKEIAKITGGTDMLEAQYSDQDREPHAFSEIAVLCRTHRQLQLLETCLQHDDIPCVISGRSDSLNTDPVRGILAFFRSLLHPDPLTLANTLSLIWDCPADLIQKIQRTATQCVVFDPEPFREIVQGYGHLEVWLSRCEEWLPLVQKEKPWKLIQRWEAAYGTSPGLQCLRNMAIFHDSFADFSDALMLGQESDLHRASGKGWESGAVRLMTLHASKGLQFPVVFVAGLNHGTLPLESKGRSSDPDEERRLLYVGMTRAQQELILTTSSQPSPFLDDLPPSVTRETLSKRRERPAEQLSLF